jgi:hypothetical protein
VIASIGCIPDRPNTDEVFDRIEVLR